MKKTEVLPLWQITFDPLKNRLKNIYQWSKTCVFFHQKSEGIAFTFCRYLNQNMRAFTFCRYCPPIVFYPPIWMIQKSRAIPWEFWDEVFSLSMPSVCPRLTTVWLWWILEQVQKVHELTLECANLRFCLRKRAYRRTFLKEPW